MVDEAIITRHGNPALPAAAPGRPLVTFALFAFNQERFVREAIGGAFAQTYTPLEIILTDDCSTDQTPAIMAEMAAGYEGPHRIVLRRGTRNLGTLAHVLHTARLAEGALFVVAAGDDVSLPERTARIAERMRDSAALAYSGDEIALDEAGHTEPMDAARIAARDALHCANPAWLHGATAAYRTAFLRALPVPDYPVLYEDLTFRELLRLRGQSTLRSHDQLIMYRQHGENIYNAATATDAETRDRHLRRDWQRLAHSYRYLQAQGLSEARTMRASPLRRLRYLAGLRSIVLAASYFRLLAGGPHRGPLAKLALLSVAAIINQPENHAWRTARAEVSGSAKPRALSQEIA